MRSYERPGAHHKPLDWYQWNHHGSLVPSEGTIMADLTPPRRSPAPCHPECPGWAVFEVNRCVVHGDDCDCWGDDCHSLEIEACDACWYGQGDAPTDDDYQGHPVCQAQLARELGRA